MEKNIETLFWEKLKPGETPEERFLDIELRDFFYETGFVDTKRIPRELWERRVSELPKVDDDYRVTRAALAGLRPLLYPGQPRKPFDPFQLKDGMRAQTWFLELYNKVLKYETELKLQDWQNIAARELGTWLHQNQFTLNRLSKQRILEIIDEHASPLRRLEQWIHHPSKTEPKPKAKPAPAPPPPPIQDRFELANPKTKQIQAIEKTYDQPQNHPPILDDAEALNILQALEELDEDEDLTF